MPRGFFHAKRGERLPACLRGSSENGAWPTLGIALTDENGEAARASLSWGLETKSELSFELFPPQETLFSSLLTLSGSRGREGNTREEQRK